MARIPAKHRVTFSRLRRATEQLHELIETGEFHSYGYLKRRALLRRVRKLYNQLAGPVSPAAIAGAIVGAGVLALAGCPSAVDPVPTNGDNGGPPGPTPQTPNFGTYQINPFGLATGSGYVYYAGYLVAADIDNDGDLDLFYSEIYWDPSYGISISFQRNTGGPSFQPVQRDPFGLAGIHGGEYSGSLYIYGAYVSPVAFVDTDGDGDLDLIASGFVDGYDYDDYAYFYHQGLLLVENTGTATSPSFALPVPFAPNAGIPSFLVAAALVDIDGDGDLDVITATEENVYLTKNTSGSPTVFQFADDSTVAFPYANLVLPAGFVIGGMTIVDLDRDGNLDILLAGHSPQGAKIIYFENTTAGATPTFAAPVTNPFGISFPDRDWYTYAGFGLSLVAADFDGDGDIDLLVGVNIEYVQGYPYLESEFLYFENKAIP